MLFLVLPKGCLCDSSPAIWETSVEWSLNVKAAKLSFKWLQTSAGDQHQNSVVVEHLAYLFVSGTKQTTRQQSPQPLGTPSRPQDGTP